MTKVIKILLLLSFLAVHSCSPTKPIAKHLDKKKDVQTIAKEKYGNKYLLVYNNPKDYALCISIEKTKIPGNRFMRYFIFDITKNLIVSEDRIRNGKVSWNSDYEIKIVELSNIVKKDDSGADGFILNVKKDFKTK